MKEARIWAVMGASGTGKDAWTKQQLARLKPGRLLIWDTMGEYGDQAQEVGSLAELAGATSAKRYALRYRPRGRDEKAVADEFAMFCRIAWERASEDWKPGACVVMVSELSRVTKPSAAPYEWSQLTTAGRHRGLHIIGTSQFPAQVDKAFLGNATLIHCGHLANARHRAAVALELDCSPDTLLELADLEWVEKRRGERELRRGRLDFAPRQPRRSPSGASAPSPKPKR